MAIIELPNGVSLEYEAYGDSDDPLVMLIPGAGAPMGFWPNDVCENIAASGRLVVRYCHRDSGASTHFDEPYPIEALLDDLTALVKALSSETAHLVGHSMGGYLAQLAMCAFPQKILSVVSISAGSTVSDAYKAQLGISSPTEETWKLLMENNPQGDFEKDLDGWMGSWRLLNGALTFDENAATEYTRLLYIGDHRNAEVAANHIHAMSTVPDDLVLKLPVSECPVLVIHGTHDPLVPFDNGESTAKLASNGELHPLDGAGHMFFNKVVWREIQHAIVRHTTVRDVDR